MVLFLPGDLSRRPVGYNGAQPTGSRYHARKTRVRLLAHELENG